MSRVSSSLATLGVVLGPFLALPFIACGIGDYKMDYIALGINVVLMFGSAILGVVFGTINQNRLDRITKDAARQNLGERLREAVQFNVDRMNDIEAHLTGKATGTVSSPDFLLDTALINHVLFSGRDLFASNKEYEDLNWHRYQIEHINNKLRLLSEPSLFAYYRASILEHIPGERTALTAWLARNRS
jgi:hypothetical protein